GSRSRRPWPTPCWTASSSTRCCATSAATAPPRKSLTSTSSRCCRPCWRLRRRHKKSPRAALPSRAINVLAAAIRLEGAAQALQRLGEDGLAVGVGAALLHVGEVSLVRLDAGRGGRVRLVLAGREAATRALPLVGNRGVGRETRPGLVPVGAKE